MSMGEHRLLIDGALVGAASGATFDNVNPATEEVIGATADASHNDMDRAIAAARRAFDETSWASDPKFRSRCLEQLHAALEEAKEELRQIVVAEAGAPLGLTYYLHLDEPIRHVAYWARMASSYEYEQELPEAPLMAGPARRIYQKVPFGVVAAITPFNYPVYENICKAAPALAAGNTVVLKPSPETPWSATYMGRLIAEKTDLPPGVINIVVSSDVAVAETLTTDPRVDLVTFTGSDTVGRQIMAAASRTLKKVIMELGGKSANILLDDAPFEEAVPAGSALICGHAGQGCGLLTRMLVPRSRYDEAVELAAAGMAAVKYGDPTDIENIQGPVVSRKQHDRVLAYIEKGRAEGGRVVVGGRVPSHLTKGYYVEPTLLADVDPRATIAQEEIFGPVLCLLAFDDDADAIRIANDSEYGLMGGVWSASEERAMAIARGVRAGTIMVNGAIAFNVDTPFGGMKRSGFGRENGTEGFDEFLQTKVYALPPAGGVDTMGWAGGSKT